MPNSRRRRFSVHNGIGGKETCKLQSHSQISSTQQDTEIKSTQTNSSKISSKHKIQAASSKNSTLIDIVTESNSTSSLLTVKKLSNNNVDKVVPASFSNIDQLTNTSESKEVSQNSKKSTERSEGPKRERQLTRDTLPQKHDKVQRQHRIKVRSPRRRIVSDGPIALICKLEVMKNSVGTSANELEQEEEVCVENMETLVLEGISDHSLDDMCRICHGGEALSLELGQLISACSCRGTVGRVHVKCLERWLTESGKSRCELCGTRYATRRVHRYGVPRALVMWILSQNAKQLMVDSLGIMLMSPLAVLAAWLSGRTLAGLMTQENHSAPWPLASTFVLACMTLVCYYCWIVSAATRHALSWWVWYRSQYEVRLTMLSNEE